MLFDKAAVPAVCAAVMAVCTAAGCVEVSAEKSIYEAHIPVKVSDVSGEIPEGTVFDVELTALDGAPLPEKSSYEVGIGTEFDLGPILFDEPGNFRYTLTESAGDNEEVVADKTVYEILVTVLYRDGELVGAVTAANPGSTGKMDEIDFMNGLASPPSDDSSRNPSHDESSRGGSTDGDSRSSDSAADNSRGTDSASPESGSEDMISDSSNDIWADSLGGDSEADVSEREDSISPDSKPTPVNSSDSSNGKDSQISRSDSSSRRPSVIGSLVSPETGGKVTLTFTGIAVSALILSLWSRRHDDGE